MYLINFMCLTQEKIPPKVLNKDKKKLVILLVQFHELFLLSS